MDIEHRQQTDVLTAVLDNIAQAMVVIGPDLRVRAFNQRFIDLFRLPPEAFRLGIDFRDVLRIWARHTGQDDAMLERAIRELGLREHFVFEFPHRVAGEERWCQLFHNPLPDGGLVRTFTDTTEQRQTEESIRQKTRLLTTVMDNMAQGLVVTDPSHRVLEHNGEFRRMLRLGDGEPLKEVRFLDLIRRWAERVGQPDLLPQNALERLADPQPYRFELRQEGEGSRWLDVFHNPLPEGGFVRTFTDISARKDLEAELRISASIDPLTEIPNRREFLGKLAEEIARAQRYRHRLVLIMVDIDRFKQINDRWGHPVGDLALRHFVAVSRTLVRQNDLLGRFGGEEFGLLLPETGLAAGTGTAKRLRQAVQDTPLDTGNGRKPLRFTISAGVTAYIPGEPPTQFWARADDLMYQAKKAGRNTVKAG